MAVAAQSSGTQAAVVGTEHTLLDVAIAGTFTLHVDAGAMAAGDSLELRVYQIVLTGGAREQVYLGGPWGDVQDSSTNELSPIKISVPISNELADAGSLRFTLKQTTGTGRSFPWKVLKYG